MATMSSVTLVHMNVLQHSWIAADTCSLQTVVSDSIVPFVFHGDLAILGNNIQVEVVVSCFLTDGLFQRVSTPPD